MFGIEYTKTEYSPRCPFARQAKMQFVVGICHCQIDKKCITDIPWIRLDPNYQSPIGYQFIEYHMRLKYFLEDFGCKIRFFAVWHILDVCIYHVHKEFRETLINTSLNDLGVMVANIYNELLCYNPQQ